MDIIISFGCLHKIAVKRSNEIMKVWVRNEEEGTYVGKKKRNNSRGGDTGL